MYIFSSVASSSIICFSSPDPKGHVSFCHQSVSIVGVRHVSYVNIFLSENNLEINWLITSSICDFCADAKFNMSIRANNDILFKYYSVFFLNLILCASLQCVWFLHCLEIQDGCNGITEARKGPYEKIFNKICFLRNYKYDWTQTVLNVLKIDFSIWKKGCI